jgi:hypothetical protein
MRPTINAPALAANALRIEPRKERSDKDRAFASDQVRNPPTKNTATNGTHQIVLPCLSPEWKRYNFRHIFERDTKSAIRRREGHSGDIDSGRRHWPGNHRRDSQGARRSGCPVCVGSAQGRDVSTTRSAPCLWVATHGDSIGPQGANWKNRCAYTGAKHNIERTSGDFQSGKQDFLGCS